MLKKLSKKDLYNIYILPVKNVTIRTLKIIGQDFNALIMSFKKNTMRDKAVPRCKMMIKNKSAGVPNNLLNINKCPELDIGRNSVIPWIIDKIKSLITIKLYQKQGEYKPENTNKAKPFISFSKINTFKKLCLFHSTAIIRREKELRKEEKSSSIFPRSL